MVALDIVQDVFGLMTQIPGVASSSRWGTLRDLGRRDISPACLKPYTKIILEARDVLVFLDCGN